MRDWPCCATHGHAHVRGFHAWRKAGHVVRKGQTGITIVAPVMGGESDAKVVSIKPASVFVVTQTNECSHPRGVAP